MAIQPGTNRQIPDHSIMDFYNKQTYLGNAYGYSLDSTEITTTSEYPLILLSNPALSGLAPSAQGTNVCPSIFVKLKKIICVTASESAILRAYLNPTVTGAGTDKTAVNLRIASSNTSVGALSINPTVSANGKLVSVLASNAFVPSSEMELLVLDPGQSMLITVQASSTSTYVNVESHWYEM